MLFVVHQEVRRGVEWERRGISLSPLVYLVAICWTGHSHDRRTLAGMHSLHVRERQVPTALKNFKQFELFGLDGDNHHCGSFSTLSHGDPPMSSPQVTIASPSTFL